MAGFHSALILLVVLAVEGRWLPHAIVANPSPFNGCDLVSLLAYSPIDTSVTYTDSELRGWVISLRLIQIEFEVVNNSGGINDSFW